MRNKIRKGHTMARKIIGKYMFVTIRMVPLLSGARIVVTRVHKELQNSRIVFTSPFGSTKTLGKFAMPHFIVL